MTTEAEIGVTQPRDKECWRPPEAARSGTDPLVDSPEGAWPCQQTPQFRPSETDFGLRASRTVRIHSSYFPSPRRTEALPLLWAAFSLSLTLYFALVHLANLNF